MYAHSSKIDHECNFVLHNIPWVSVSSLKELKCFLSSSLRLDVITAVGYFFRGKMKVCLQTDEELSNQLETELCKGNNMLWCEAAERSAATNKHGAPCNESENLDEEELVTNGGEDAWPKKKTKSLAEEKCKRVQKLVDELKTRHQPQFTGPQHRLWAIAIDVYQHGSMEVPRLSMSISMTVWKYLVQ